MPMKLNVGVSRKVGLPDYGSVGASCNLELELDSGSSSGTWTASMPASATRTSPPTRPSMTSWPGSRYRSTPVPNGRLRSPPGRSPGMDMPGRTGTVRRLVTRMTDRGLRKPATPNQVKAILAIARRQNTDLVGLLRDEYEVERPEDLTIRQASELIDLLKNSGTA